MKKCVYDTNKGITYDSITQAVKGTDCPHSQIKEDCERFHDNPKIIPRFVYSSDIAKANI